MPTVRRRRLLLAAAAALVLVGAGVWAGAAGRSAPPTRPTTIEATDSVTHVHARVALTAQASGSAVTVALRGVPAGERCQLLAVGTDGRREVAATWVADYRGTADVHGSVDLSPPDIARLQVQTSDGRVLVTLGG